MYLFYGILAAVVAAAACYAAYCVARPTRPFKRRASAGISAFFLFALVNAISEARVDYMRDHDPAAFAAYVATKHAQADVRNAERAAKEAKRQRQAQAAQERKQHKHAQADARNAERTAKEAERQRQAQAAQERKQQAAALRAQEQRCGNEIEALTYAREAVKRKLKAPATAEFPWPNDERVEVLSCGRFRVRDYVDAQNGFGAMLRNQFAVTMRKEADAWVAEEVRIW